MVRRKVLVAFIWMFQMLYQASSQQIQAATIEKATFNFDDVLQDNDKMNKLSTNINSKKLKSTTTDENAVVAAILNRQGSLGGLPLSHARSQTPEPFHFVPMVRRTVPQTATPVTEKSIQTSDITNLQMRITMLENMISGLIKNAMPTPIVNESVAFTVKSPLESTGTPIHPTTPLPANVISPTESTTKFSNGVTTSTSKLNKSEKPNIIPTLSDPATLEMIGKLVVTMFSDSSKSVLPNDAANAWKHSPDISTFIPSETDSSHSSTLPANLGRSIGNGGLSLSSIDSMISGSSKNILSNTAANVGVPLPDISTFITPGTDHSTLATNLGNSIGNGGVPLSAIAQIDSKLGTPSSKGGVTLSDISLLTSDPTGSLVTNSEVSTQLPTNHSDLTILDDVNLRIQTSDISALDIPSLPSLDNKEELDIKSVGIQLQTPKGATEFILGKQQTKPASTAVTSIKLSNPETPVVKSLISPATGGSFPKAIQSAGSSFGAPISEPHTYPAFPTTSTPYGSNGMQSHSTSLYSGSHHGELPPRHNYIRLRRPVKQKSKEKDLNYYYEKMKNWFIKDDKKDEKKVVSSPQSHYPYYPNVGTYEMPYYYPTSGLYGVPEPYQIPIYQSTPRVDSGPEFWGYSFSLEGVNDETFDVGGNGASNVNRGPGESFNDNRENSASDVNRGPGESFNNNGENGTRDINQGPGVTLSDINGVHLPNLSLVTRSTDNLDNLASDGNNQNTGSSVNRGPGVTDPHIPHQKIGGSVTLKWLSW